MTSQITYLHFDHRVTCASPTMMHYNITLHVTMALLPDSVGPTCHTDNEHEHACTSTIHLAMIAPRTDGMRRIRHGVMMYEQAHWPLCECIARSERALVASLLRVDESTFWRGTPVMKHLSEDKEFSLIAATPSHCCITIVRVAQNVDIG